MSVLKTAMLSATVLTFGAGHGFASSETNASANANMGTEILYIQYDTNNDGILNEDEFQTYSYNVIDYDNDDRVSEEEWDYYTDVWYDPLDFSYDTAYDFDYYDTDNDGYLEMTEYESAYDTDIYSAWDIDSDGYIETMEYADARNIYVNADTDGLYTW